MSVEWLCAVIMRRVINETIISGLIRNVNTLPGSFFTTTNTTLSMNY